MMSITLNFRRTNLTVGKIELYHSLNTFDPENPGTPIAVFDINAFNENPRYIHAEGDASVENFYTLAYLDGNIRKFGETFKHSIEYMSGPGGGSVVTGNTRDGYYGALSLYDLPSPKHWWPNEVLSYQGFDATKIPTHGMIAYKFARNGKIFYVTAPGTIASDISVAVARESGLATNGIALPPGSNIPAVSRTFTDGIYTYRARMLRGLPDNWNGDETNISELINGDTEFNMIANVVLGNWPASKGRGLPQPGSRATEMDLLTYGNSPAWSPVLALLTAETLAILPSYSVGIIPDYVSAANTVPEQNYARAVEKMVLNTPSRSIVYVLELIG